MTGFPDGSYDPASEPFAGGIDPRVLGRALSPPPPAGVDPTTGEVVDRRAYGPGEDVSKAPWPSPSRGPLPPPESIPPDLNIYTAQDEIDAWAHEHNEATNLLARLRTELAGDGERSVEVLAMKAKARYRRQARASPTERGRRTGEDITEEVNEKLAVDPHYLRKLELETAIGIALDRLFRARDNQHRLENYVRSLPRVSDGAAR